MKTKRKLIILSYLVFILILFSCKNGGSQKNTNEATYLNADGTEKFLVPENLFSDFIVMSSSLYGNNKPSTVVYTVKVTLKNNTKNIYQKAFIRGELILVLENGNQLSCTDINYSKSYWGGVISESKSNWKPNEDWNIDQLESCTFSVEYFDYPVKEVYTQYYLELTDQINNTTEEIMISQRDVTDKWLKAKNKIKIGTADCTDNLKDVSQFLGND
ncbi:hypothetical protein MC916_002609 [Elizabethkingia anophelis]|uniref:hypothetical protein n=1 Tax=Elizabethkingia anophelis TaxID=1117645 RepID=UPI001D499C1A|nr:hypothetical protein [Elizabethkingia anophelis]EHM7982731.1 hypothetical protein [Elizabethkingia anophelis]EHM8032434.1 hypothetical protein [Elizabethkingia anophelis]EHZ9535404.1 hypothetical protein [Elizabethkingia anophelis]EKU3673314.1 hypothetical protein [Elizabethkingia anophelis]EKU4210293.1 hypothetical protein [Elizabethkingia anophelis]